jgi:hypothetical protein
MILCPREVFCWFWQGGKVDSVAGGRSAHEIRDRFRERLNHALLFPGMQGGEFTLQQLLDDLMWIDGREPPGGSVDETLSAMGAWSATGVGGVFARMLDGRPADHLAAAALVYADLAWGWGYLVPGRRLTAGEYARLCQEARRWTAAADRTVADVIAAFGTPSLWRPKYNPRYPVSIAYVPGSQSAPLVAFDFWQHIQFAGETPRSRPWPEPVLRNVRWRTGHFEEGFTFSPVGATLLARGRLRAE